MAKTALDSTPDQKGSWIWLATAADPVLASLRKTRIVATDPATRTPSTHVKSKKRRKAHDRLVSERREPGTPSAHGGSGKRVGKNLVALGSAAVLAVYAAGFLRTRAAAQRFERNPDSGRSSVSPPARLAEHAVVPPPQVEAIASASQPVPALEPAPLANANLSPPIPPTPAVVPAAPPAPTSGPAATVVIARAADSPPAPTAAAIAPLAPAAANPSPASVGVAQIAETTAKPADSKRAGLKDGTFYGWGSCRHGDLQACLEIQGGRIVAASISQCLTRYSCDVISMLPPQVVARQSSDIDYVSGATQSADAFHDAVIEALYKAQ